MQKRKKKLGGGGLEKREVLNGPSIGSQVKNEILNLNIHVHDSPQTLLLQNSFVAHALPHFSTEFD